MKIFFAYFMLITMLPLYGMKQRLNNMLRKSALNKNLFLSGYHHISYAYFTKKYPLFSTIVFSQKNFYCTTNNINETFIKHVLATYEPTEDPKKFILALENPFSRTLEDALCCQQLLLKTKEIDGAPNQPLYNFIKNDNKVLIGLYYKSITDSSLRDFFSKKVLQTIYRNKLLSNQTHRSQKFEDVRIDLEDLLISEIGMNSLTKKTIATLRRFSCYFAFNRNHDTPLTLKELYDASLELIDAHNYLSSHISQLKKSSNVQKKESFVALSNRIDNVSKLIDRINARIHFDSAV
jgi:hypothetical protein